MINLEALIRQSQELLQELKDGTHELIERSTPATWGELQQKLIDYGIPILKKLYEPIGGLTVIPEVDLPDGVTSTSLVSQSEMVQFVTNTLDTWLVGLMDRVKEASKNTIYNLQPVITAIHYIPRKIHIEIKTPTENIVTQPTFIIRK